MNHIPKSDHELFNSALGISDAADVIAFLVRECAGDHVQHARVQALLVAFAKAEGFMEPGKCPPGWCGGIFERPAEHFKVGPDSIIGPYKLLRKIGEGGVGVVYGAEQMMPVKRKVALKVIKPGMSCREINARFEAERQTLEQMDHPNIVRFFAVGVSLCGRPFLVMELVAGIPVTRFCNANNLSIERRLGLFLDICAAVQHVHLKGVIHRDLNPSNILVVLVEGKPVPKLIDFGIATPCHRALEGETLPAASGRMFGTPQYTSPEQAESGGLTIDTRSDIFSLGVLLYELLTGETPISGAELGAADSEAIPALICAWEPSKPSVAPSLLDPEFSPAAESGHSEAADWIEKIEGDLDEIVLKALAKDRDARYETAHNLAEDLRCYLENEPLLLAPPPLSGPPSQLAFVPARKPATRGCHEG
ncbi:MAG: serine/threonine protein kinase [Kiritimatiellae bacterium]|nr:serine/threonine protein kinase [Kiritimatiellia bacterium]